jgi:hypothetical protein
MPKSLPEPAHDASNGPIIRIASIQQPPERIVIDTSQPTIIPPPTLFTDAVPDAPPPPMQSYASTILRTTVAGADKKSLKIIRKHVKEVAAKQAPSSRTTAVAGGTSATIVPRTRLSFASIISGQIVRDLFNLN